MSPTSSSCVSLIHVSSHQRILNVNQLAGTIPSSFGSLITLRIVYVTRLLVPRWCLPISQRIKQETLWQSIERHHSSFLWLPLESSTTVCESLDCRLGRTIRRYSLSPSFRYHPQRSQYQPIEWHHSIANAVARESPVTVRIDHATSQLHTVSFSVLTTSVQLHPHQSIEWYYSIIDWISRKSSVTVRWYFWSISTPSSLRDHTSTHYLSLMTSQATLWQSIERCHSIHDCISVESSGTVRQSTNEWHTRAPSICKENDAHRMIISNSPNRDLSINQLSGTIPSSIGSLMKLQSLYVNQLTSIRSAKLIAIRNTCSGPSIAIN
mgnify:CR=1 FL=1